MRRRLAIVAGLGIVATAALVLVARDAPPDAVEVLVEYFRVVAGEHPDWDEYRRAMVDQGKCVIRLTPRRWGPVATGGFPPPAG